MAEIGSVLGGRYRLIELLGQGGMASIYRAHDSQLNRDVAVKVLRPEYGRDPDFGARFRVEAHSAAALNHPNIVSVFDFGQDEHGPYIVMELVTGEDLATILRRSGPLAPRQAARLAGDVARALSAAHASGIVHRDVKPGNILISEDGRVKVTDFGIARAIAEAQMTLPGMTMGSVHYFSPEQARGEPATPASDIYSLGIVLFEVLTGSRPFEGDTAAAIAVARLSGPPPNPSDVRVGIPPALEAIDRRALALDPGERFPSAGLMADALDHYLQDRGAEEQPSVPPVPTSPAPQAAAPTTSPTPAPPSAPVSRSPAPSPRTQPPTVAVAAATARANPPRIPYSDDAYADVDYEPEPVSGPRRPVRRSGRPPFDEGDGGGGPWIWISGLLGIAILALVAFLVFRFVTTGVSNNPGAGTQVTVPDLKGMLYSDALKVADRDGLALVRNETDSTTGAPTDTILDQDPVAGTIVAKGTEIRLRLAQPPETVAVPYLLNLSEADAVRQITAAGLNVGTRTEAADAVFPAGSIVHQDPSPGTKVGKQTTVNYVVSTGPPATPSPSASASPSPEPSPTPTLEPTVPPTAPPTPQPTPTPTPGPRNVGDYTCLTFAAAATAIEGDGFTIGTISGPSSGKVVEQAPSPGSNRPFGFPVDLTFEDPPTITCP